MVGIAQSPGNEGQSTLLLCLRAVVATSGIPVPREREGLTCWHRSQTMTLQEDRELATFTRESGAAEETPLIDPQRPTGRR